MKERTLSITKVFTLVLLKPYFCSMTMVSTQEKPRKTTVSTSVWPRITPSSCMNTPAGKRLATAAWKFVSSRSMVSAQDTTVRRMLSLDFSPL